MRVQGVPVRIERVPSIPYGVKVFIDGPPNEAIVAWVREDQNEQEAASLIARCLAGVSLKGRRELFLFAS